MKKRLKGLTACALAAILGLSYTSYLVNAAETQTDRVADTVLSVTL